MKSNFKAQILACLLPKKLDKAGFTLIELLIVTIIIGILSAIALPSLIKQAYKAKQVEAKLAVGSMNRSQQAYYLENTVFADSLDELAIGIEPQTDNYEYSILLNGTIASNNGVSKAIALKSYLGVNYTRTITLSPGQTESVTIGILCESPAAGIGTPQNMTTGNCPTGWTLLPK